MNVDLHSHTTYSDGALHPTELVKLAVKEGVTTLAITDHDNILSHQIAKDFAEENFKDQIEIVPGVEVNTIWNDKEVHILGYYMDFENADFKKMLAYQQHVRVEQTMQIIDELKKQAGIVLKYEDIQKLTETNGSIGRPHLAKALALSGGARDTMEAYDKYINIKASTYVIRKTVSPHEAVETIYEAGGVPVIAHPCDVENAEELIKDFMSFGLRGIEAYHRKHSPAMVEYYSSLAEKYELIVTGGSDFHAVTPSNTTYLGKNFVPDWVIDKLKREKQLLSLSRG